METSQQCEVRNNLQKLRHLGDVVDRLISRPRSISVVRKYQCFTTMKTAELLSDLTSLRPEVCVSNPMATMRINISRRIGSQCGSCPGLRKTGGRPK